jgi:hypothetical protein
MKNPSKVKSQKDKIQDHSTESQNQNFVPLAKQFRTNADKSA